MKKKLFLLSVPIACSLFFTGCAGGSASGTFLTFEADLTTPVYLSGGDTAPSSVKLMGEELCVIDTTETGILTDLPEFAAEALLAVDNDTNELLYQKNVYETLYPASLTKLMTAYVFYESGMDQSQEFTVPLEATQLPDIYAKKCGLQEGDVITLRELLHATLIHSSNDAAKALAIAVSGSEEAFTDEMNKAAAKLGATHSHFSNSHGLHSEDHYTTMYDLYLIFHELIQNEDFVSIIQNGQWELVYKNASGNEVRKNLASTIKYKTGAMESPSFFSIVGGKTGTTNQAGSCMMLYCEDLSGKGYIVSVLNAEDPDELYSEFKLLFESMADSE